MLATRRRNTSSTMSTKVSVALARLTVPAQYEVATRATRRATGIFLGQAVLVNPPSSNS